MTETTQGIFGLFLVEKTIFLQKISLFCWNSLLAVNCLWCRSPSPMFKQIVNVTIQFAVTGCGYLEYRVKMPSSQKFSVFGKLIGHNADAVIWNIKPKSLVGPVTVSERPTHKKKDRKVHFSENFDGWSEGMEIAFWCIHQLSLEIWKMGKEGVHRCKKILTKRYCVILSNYIFTFLAKLHCSVNCEKWVRFRDFWFHCFLLTW